MEFTLTEKEFEDLKWLLDVVVKHMKSIDARVNARHLLKIFTEEQDELR